MISAFVLQKANKIIHFWIICTIQIWMKVSLLLGHSKLGIVSVQPILMILNMSLHRHETPENTMRHIEAPTDAIRPGFLLEIYFQMVHNALVSWYRYETPGSRVPLLNAKWEVRSVTGAYGQNLGSDPNGALA